MAYWEFLLQKEGDRDWLPLETAHVEISEGRYRIIAHTSYCETSVEIRLNRLLAQQLPPRWKTLKRLGQTTDSGLMVVMPFTHLAPGRWTLACAQATTSGAPPAWEYGVQLQVLAIESGLIDWETDLEAMVVPLQASEAGLPPDQGQAAPLSSAPATRWSPDVSQSPPEKGETAPQPTLPDTASLADLPLRLQLQHQALVAQPQTAIQLQGQVTSFSEVAGLPTETTLWLQLRDPETGTCIHQVSGALSLGILPYRFDVPITLPSEVTTRLLVGELSLWTASDPPQVLAIQGFTITLNLDALLEMVANQAEQSPEAAFEDLTTAAELTVTETATDETAATARVLSPLAPREIPFRLIYLPATGLTLPPVIYRPVDMKTVGSPSLPPLANQSPRRRATAPIAPEPPAKPLTLPPLGKSRPSPPVTAPLEELLPPESAVDLPALGRSHPDAVPALEPLETPPAAPDAPPGQGPESTTFRPDFQGRFWERLSALAAEAQKAAAEFQAQIEAAGVETTQEPPATLLPNLQFPDFPEDPTTVNHEVVIYEPAADEFLGTTDPLVDLSSEVPVVEVLQPGEPDLEDFGAIPVPQLVMSEGDLIAGAALPITVRLPLYPRRLAVKVWVTDIQSRSLADRPRWLMNWTPTDTGEQTALLQLQVPLGSVEAKFEAIAIDLATQRESYKTVQVRSILPPNLPPTDLLDPL